MKNSALQDQVSTVSSKIINTKHTRLPVLIAIEGYGGSGKSTTAKLLSAQLNNAYVINFDDFIIKDKISDADKSGFDKKRLEMQVLKPAISGKPISYQSLLWDDNVLSDPIIVPPVDYLIVEGISAYHPSIAHYFDYKIWIKTSMDKAKLRGANRDRLSGDNNDKLWEIWAKSDIEYQNRYLPHEIADFTIINEESA